MIIYYIELALVWVLRFEHIVIILIVNNIEQPIILLAPLWIIHFIILISSKPVVIVWSLVQGDARGTLLCNDARPNHICQFIQNPVIVMEIK